MSIPSRDFKIPPGKKVPPKNQTPPEPVKPKLDKNKYKTQAEYDKAVKAWEQEHKAWTEKYGKKEAPKKKEPAPKKPQFTKTYKKTAAPVKGKLTTGEKGRISKRMAKRHTNIKGGSVNVSPHEMTLNQLFKNLR
tara:strand:+ start:85 stop:489 length:405 start_codon:yes stop_codon:yes gene_type:complete